MQFNVSQTRQFLQSNTHIQGTQYIMVTVQLVQIFQKSDTFVTNSDIERGIIGDR